MGRYVKQHGSAPTYQTGQRELPRCELLHQRRAALQTARANAQGREHFAARQLPHQHPSPHSCLAPCGFASHAYEKVNLVLLAFAIRKWAGTPSPREGQKLKWVRPNELFALDMPPADKPLLGQIVAVL